MDIYHSTYTQYIDLMDKLKDDVEELLGQAAGMEPEEKSDERIFTLIGQTIDTASDEKFLPTNELLNITKELLGIKRRLRPKAPLEQRMLKQCFRTLNSAAVSLRQITDDCPLAEVNELSEKEMY
ncbi:MAG: hypothetical protein IJP82_10250 [Bacteroidaceae bacterium]|nr:hypothetical protein [Bacteroidaceae bacterium]